MLKTSILSLALGLLSVATFADEKQEFKMAVVDFQAALNGVEEGKVAKSKLKKEFEGKQKDLEKRKAELEKLQTEIEDFQQKARSGLLKPEMIEQGQKKEAEFRTKLEAYTKLVQESQQNISEKEMNATRGILNRLRDLVVEVGRKEGYALVLEKNESGLLYAASYTDLTEKLIQQYNKKFK